MKLLNSIQELLQLSCAGQLLHVGATANKVALDKHPGHAAGAGHLSQHSLNLIAVLSILNLNRCELLSNFLKFLKGRKGVIKYFLIMTMLRMMIFTFLAIVQYGQ